MKASLSNKVLPILLTILLLILLSAGLGKLFYPQPYYEGIQQAVGGVQILFCGVALFFYRRQVFWIGLILLFSFFLGFSAFMVWNGGSCFCFGDQSLIQAKGSLILALVSIVVSFLGLRCCGYEKHFSLITICSQLCLLLGFLLATFFS